MYGCEVAGYAWRFVILKDKTYCLSDVYSGIDSIAIGTCANATATSATAVGDLAQATALDASAFGQEAKASGVKSLASGFMANASGAHATAVGNNTTAAFSNSAAFGNGATATRADQQVFGTASNTYTTPGITSGASLGAQAGPLQLVTTDAAGNLASDHGAVFKAIAKVEAGVAIALAIEAPSLTTGETFGIRAGIGNYDGNANAFGVSAIGVLGTSVFQAGDRVAVDAGVGVGQSDFYGYNSDAVYAGRAGVQWTFR